MSNINIPQTHTFDLKVNLELESTGLCNVRGPGGTLEAPKLVAGVFARYRVELTPPLPTAQVCEVRVRKGQESKILPEVIKSVQLDIRDLCEAGQQQFKKTA